MNDLAIRSNVAALVAVYKAAERDVRRACDLLANAEIAMQKAYRLGAGVGFSLHGRHQMTVEMNADNILDNMRREAWDAIVERLEIRRMLSIGRAAELNERLRRGVLPEITEEAVADFAAFYVDHQRDMLAEAVVEVFEWLRPRRSKYKRNSEEEVPRRVVLEHLVEMMWSGKLHVRYDRGAELVALDNVFSWLDGCGSIAKTYKGPLHDAIDGAPVGSTEYFDYRAHKNGNLHLTFRREDLLARFNAIAGGARLRAASGDAIVSV